MSSRALRKAQKEIEERERLEKLARENEEEDDVASEEDEEPVSKPKPSLFALLGDAADEQDEDEEEEDETPEKSFKPEVEATAPPSKSKKSKKKKKKGKAKAEPAAPEETEDDLDEIDRALAELEVKPQGSHEDASAQGPAISEEKQQLYSVLAVDTQQLKAHNEERKLFGNIAAQNDRDEQPRARQRGRGQQQPGATGNRNLGQLGLRKNIFIQGKEEWPRATTGGLAMEVVEKCADGTVEYRFVHSRAYQDVQNQFQVCVESMDSERMLQLLHFNPYHISTLLQVSEIFKQQRESAQAGELLERALFNFGRAVHSTFAHNLSQGKARLDFRRYENREFWLAVWRYIEILGHRALWRTAFEWTKLLLSVAPDTDPYCMRLLVDQMALRGREPQSLVDIVDSDHLQRLYRIPPNFAYSVALAHNRLKDPVKSRSALKLAVQQYPWIAARLCKELDIAPIPKSVWGKEPSDDYQELLCQLYISKAKDLWNNPESTSLLVEVLYSFTEPLDSGNDYWLSNIPETDLARHVILSDDKTLLSLIDNRIKSKYTSVSDPLPPVDSIASYTFNTSTGEGRHPQASELIAQFNQLQEQLVAGRPAAVQHARSLGREQLQAELAQLRREHEELDMRNNGRHMLDSMLNGWNQSVLMEALREMGVDEDDDGEESRGTESDA